MAWQPKYEPPAKPALAAGKAGNIQSQAVRKAKSAERAEYAKTLYAEGKTQKQIAAILGLNQGQVSRLLRS
jgi:DNA-binding transcriptional regulator LsrR (DeoR family)